MPVRIDPKKKKPFIDDEDEEQLTEQGDEFDEGWDDDDEDEWDEDVQDELGFDEREFDDVTDLEDEED